MHIRRGVALLVCGLLGSAAMAAEIRAEDLPARAQALRDGGVDADEVRQALMAAMEARLSAAAAASLLDASLGPVQEHGPVPAFGAFIKEQLDAGLRGEELASAIQAEHAKRGIGTNKGSKKPPERAKPRPAPRPRPAKPPPRPARPVSPKPAPAPAPPKTKSRSKNRRSKYRGRR